MGATATTLFFASFALLFATALLFFFFGLLGSFGRFDCCRFGSFGSFGFFDCCSFALFNC
jgi:hypothetical protein